MQVPSIHLQKRMSNETKREKKEKKQWIKKIANEPDKMRGAVHNLLEYGAYQLVGVAESGLQRYLTRLKEGVGRGK